MSTKLVADAARATTRGARGGARWLDPAGAAVSLACAVHCAAAPALLLLSPGLLGEEIEVGLSLAAIALAVATAARRWRRGRRPRVPLLVALGAALLAVRFGLAPEGSPLELTLALLGASAFVLAHVLSAREAACECC